MLMLQKLLFFFLLCVVFGEFNSYYDDLNGSNMKKILFFIPPLLSHQPVVTEVIKELEKTIIEKKYKIEIFIPKDSGNISTRKIEDKISNSSIS